MNRVYSARELIDLALVGHFCLRDKIHETIWRLYTAGGEPFRPHLYGLPPLKAYGPESELDEREAALIDKAGELFRSLQTPEDDPNQLLLFDEQG